MGLLGLRGSAIFVTEGALGAVVDFLASVAGLGAGGAGALRTALDGDGGMEPESWKRDCEVLWKAWWFGGGIDGRTGVG